MTKILKTHFLFHKLNILFYCMNDGIVMSWCYETHGGSCHSDRLQFIRRYRNAYAKIKTLSLHRIAGTDSIYTYYAKIEVKQKGMKIMYIRKKYSSLSPLAHAHGGNPTNWLNDKMSKANWHRRAVRVCNKNTHNMSKMKVVFSSYQFYKPIKELYSVHCSILSFFLLCLAQSLARSPVVFFHLSFLIVMIISSDYK